MLAKVIASLETRIKELEAFVQQSIGNHNGILGRLEEAKTILSYVTTGINDVEDVAEAIIPAPAVEPEVVPVVENAS